MLINVTSKLRLIESVLSKQPIIALLFNDNHIFLFERNTNND